VLGVKVDFHTSGLDDFLFIYFSGHTFDLVSVKSITAHALLRMTHP